MPILAGIVVAVMVLFAGLTARNEIVVYRKAIRGEVRYLVNKKRRNRRLLISLLLLLEAAFLYLGFFLVKFRTPGEQLLFWLPPLLLIFVLGYLGFVDLRETSRDIDRIFVESCLSAIKKIKGQGKDNDNN